MSKKFRGLDSEFIKELKQGKLHPLLEYESENRESLMIEIRNNELTIYFLGHGIKVVRKEKKQEYFLIASNNFDPSSLLGENSSIVQRYGPKYWQISFSDIKDAKHFGIIMDAIIGKIAEHKHGKISEGVSEANHFIDNRANAKNGILIIDRQVVYPHHRSDRIDLLGLARLKSGKATFAVIELKNKNNPQISDVFSQLKRYIDWLFQEKVYEDFRETYSTIVEQKGDLGLLVKFGCEIAPFSEIAKKDLIGIVVLDNFNVRSDIRKEGLLKRALHNWDCVGDKEYNIKMYIKTNVLDSTFLMDRNQAGRLLEDYRRCNL